MSIHKSEQLTANGRKYDEQMGHGWMVETLDTAVGGGITCEAVRNVVLASITRSNSPII